MSPIRTKLMKHNRPWAWSDLCQSPLPKSQVPRNGFDDRWGNRLLDNTPLGIGGLDCDQVCASDMYNPIIRPYPAPYGRETMPSRGLDYLRSSPLVEHIDTVTTLKGMSFAEAENLFRIQQVFKASLETFIAKDEFTSRVQQRLQQEYSRCHIPAHAGGIRISQSRLTQEIIQRLRPQDDTPFFKMLISFYLALCECLTQKNVEESQDTVLEVCVSYRGSSTSVGHLGPVLEVSRLPDLLNFDPIAEIQHEGQQLMIIPHYRLIYSPTSDAFHTDIRYTICPSHPWLSWDGSIHGFKGTLPTYSEKDDRLDNVHRAGREGPYSLVNILRIEIKAVLTIEGRQLGVRLERTLRARITIKVVPWYAYGFADPLDDHCSSSVGTQHGSPPLSPASVMSPFGTEMGSCSPHRTDDGLEQTSLADILHHETKQGGYSLDDMETLETLHTDTFRFESMECYTPEPFRPALLNQYSHKRRAPSSLLPMSPLKRHRDANSSPNSPDASSECVSWSEESLSSWNLDDDRNSESSPVLSANQSPSLRNLPLRVRTDLKKASEVNPCEVSSFAVKRLSPPALLNDAQHNCNAVVGEKPVSPAALDGFTRSATSDEHTRSASSQSNQHPSDSESDRWTRRSHSTEIILEDSLIDPGLRREQALLWKALNPSAGNSGTSEPTLHVQERKDIYDAMKKSAEEEQLRKKLRLGLVEVFDDVFLETSSDRDSGSSDTGDATVQSSSEQPGHLSEGKSEFGSADEQLADSFNYGF